MSAEEDITFAPWRVEAILAIPMSPVVPTNLEVGKPTVLFESRIPEQAVVTGGFCIQISPYKGPGWGDRWHGVQPARLVIWTVAASDQEALENVQGMLDLVINDLSFQLQEPLSIKQLEILKVPIGAEVGQEGTAWLFPYPDGYKQYKEMRNVMWGTAVQTARFPSLRSQYVAIPSKVQDALDWYLKGLHANADVDRFIAFWIAVEIMRNQSTVRVEEPTKLRCGHEVIDCPECQKPTAMYRQAGTTKQFLANLGMAEDVCKRLWRMRQIVHGAHSFDEELLRELGELIQYVQAAAMVCIKTALGSSDGFPFPTGVVPTANRGLSLSIARALTPADLDDFPKYLELEVLAKEQEGDSLYATLNQLGLALRNAGDLVGAEKIFRELTCAANPDARDAGGANLGMLLSLRGDSSGAVDELRKVIERGGHCAISAANNLAVHYIGLRMLDQAAMVLSQFSGMGGIEMATRMAEDAGDEALSVDREFAEAAYNIALMSADAQRVQGISVKLQGLANM